MCAFAVFSCCAVGCASESEIILTTYDIRLYVGESRDILPYVKFISGNIEHKNTEFVAQGDSVELDGSIVKAVKKGDATVTISANGAHAILRISVVYGATGGFTLDADEYSVQTVAVGGKPHKTVLTVQTSVSIDPEAQITWTVDGVVVQEHSSVFEFEPSGFGEYEIKASAAGNVSAQTVRVYKQTEIAVACDGVIEQDGNFSAVKLTAREKIDPNNPPSVYDWSVNGVPSGQSALFTFTPSAAGEYEIALRVNGRSVDIRGKESLTVIAHGKPALDCCVEFDDADGTYIVWNCDEYASRVTVVAPDGRRRDIDRSDAQYAYLFESGRFDADDFITVCAENRGKYDIGVQIGGETHFCSFEQYPTAAREFIDRKPFIKNLFVSSVEDGAELAEDLYACAVKSARCYSAISDEDWNEIISYARVALGTRFEFSREGNTVTLTAKDLINSPEYREQLPNVLRMYSEYPHIEYDATERRPSSHVFVSDRARGSVAVSGSEQLYFAVMRGYKPIPAAGSTADIIYSTAKNRLLGIIGVDYDDRQKAHAVYDWMQWVSVRGDNNKSSAADYLEALFGSAEIERGDVRRAVLSDCGAAKTFVFLCKLEGIECETITDGSAFRNKIFLDGMPYNIDVLSGKAYSSELGLTRLAELNSHRALFISDAAAVGLGLFDGSSAFEAFDDGNTVYLDKKKSGGIYFDRYITSGIGYDEIKTVVFDAFSHTPTGAVAVPVLSGTETYMNNAYGAELYFDGGITEKEFADIVKLLSRACDEYAEKALGAERFSSVRTYRTGNVFLLSASLPTYANKEIGHDRV